ncbi:MAG: L-seryl-tRNA(Sec) selenium transferase [bacterium]
MARNVIKKLREFPAVEELLQHRQLRSGVEAIPRPLAVQIVREVVARHKEMLRRKSETVSLSRMRQEIMTALTTARRVGTCRVINATGIIVHTNLGRAPLSEAFFESVREVLSGYGNIEFDLNRGTRGGRGAACERYLSLLAGTESAAIVNNCAAALLLILNSLANRKQVIVSRGELVQIGGGFRIPDILRKSGARLHEVGTTNITTIADYEDVVDEKTGLILKVHQSNFVQAGFTGKVSVKELVKLGAGYDLTVVNDLGSGVFVNTGKIIGYSEPTVQQSVRDGADLTCFSGDKMLGGVQAGLIVGRASLIKKIKRNPLFRTVRVDKVVLALMEKLLTSYLNGTWQTEIKLWALLSLPESELYRRGRRLLKQLGHPAGLSVEATRGFVGGGALPESGIASVGLVFGPPHRATSLMRRFRMMNPPVIGRIDDDCFILDLRAVAEDQLLLLKDSVAEAIGPQKK